MKLCEMYDRHACLSLHNCHPRKEKVPCAGCSDLSLNIGRTWQTYKIRTKVLFFHFNLAEAEVVVTHSVCTWAQMTSLTHDVQYIDHIAQLPWQCAENVGCLLSKHCIKGHFVVFLCVCVCVGWQSACETLPCPGDSRWAIGDAESCSLLLPHWEIKNKTKQTNKQTNKQTKKQTNKQTKRKRKHSVCPHANLPTVQLSTGASLGQILIICETVGRFDDRSEGMRTTLMNSDGGDERSLLPVRKIEWASVQTRLCSFLSQQAPSNRTRRGISIHCRNHARHLLCTRAIALSAVTRVSRPLYPIRTENSVRRRSCLSWKSWLKVAKLATTMLQWYICVFECSFIV